MILQLVIELPDKDHPEPKRKAEFARLLRDAARRVEAQGTVDGDLTDVHNNRVGGFQFIRQSP